jgi:hypothetical protein
MAHSKLYKLNEDKLAEYKPGVQAQLIIKSLMDRNPQTVKQIAEDIKASLQTRQQPERVVNFYMSTWKKAGMVEVVGTENEETPVSTGNHSSEAEVGDSADAITEQDYIRNAPTDLEAALEGYTEDNPDPGPEEFDWVNSSLKAAVLEAVNRGGGSTAQDISILLQMKGRTANPKQVNDAVSKLVKDGKLNRTEQGIELA